MADTEKRKILDALRSDAATLFGNHDARKLASTSTVAQQSSLLANSPSFVVMRPNSSSFQHFSEAERTDDDVTETGSAFSK